MDIFQMRQFAAQKVEEAFVRAEKYYRRTFPRAEIKFQVKGTTAGFAHYTNIANGGKVDFNECLMRENFEHFIKQTIPHEVAHLVSVHVYGIVNGRGHGKEWKSVMSSCFGLSPDRCHTYDTTNSAQRTVSRTYKYVCACSTHMLTSIKHNRIQKGATYRCNKCKTKISFVASKTAGK